MPTRNWSTVAELIEHNTVKDVECWVWLRAISHLNSSPDDDGYGVLWVGGRSHQAHRYIYEQLRGPIAVGKQLHHLCGQSWCVNPMHLLEVTPGEHVRHNTNSCATRTHCPHGHAYTPENTKRQFAPGSNGKPYWKRLCRECHRLDDLRRKVAA